MVAVAYSGGRDSSALLHATLQAAAPLGLQVLALHVHHGLSRQADAWSVHCEQRCAAYAKRGHAIRFDAARLSARPSAGESVEAWARDARYAALARMALAGRAGVVLLAQHRRDQAETFLLQALRGGGLAGLAAMPREVERDGIVWARPWLEVSPEAIAAYVRRHRLRHVDDDSNDDARFARNRLRRDVWPALTKAFPSAEGSLSQAARWAQEALQAADEWSALDLEASSSVTKPNEARAAAFGTRAATASTRTATRQSLTAATAPLIAATELSLAAWSRLSPPRRSAVLRRWLGEVLFSAAPSTLVVRLLDEIGARASAQWPVPGGNVELHRGRLRFVASRAGDMRSAAMLPAAMPVDLSRPGRHAVGAWQGEFRVESVVIGGIACTRAARLTIRPRRPGDTFQFEARRPPRSLKLQYQAAGLAASARRGPVVADDAGIVYVPGLGLDARVLASPGEARVRFDWLADDVVHVPRGQRTPP